jgi:hypothetical protein
VVTIGEESRNASGPDTALPEQLNCPPTLHQPERSFNMENV